MKRALLLLLVLGACGDNESPQRPLRYTDPAGGKLRLVRDRASRGHHLVLDLVVGDAPLTGYSVGFDLPLDDTRVTLTAFDAGEALRGPAMGKLPTDGPLAHMLVTAQTQSATADTEDATLAPGTVLYRIELDSIAEATHGIVFDGTAADFALPSGGMRDRAGETVVAADEVAIGKLEITNP